MKPRPSLCPMRMMPTCKREIDVWMGLDNRHGHGPSQHVGFVMQGLELRYNDSGRRMGLRMMGDDHAFSI